MRVRGDVQPSNAFTLEEQPKKPGFFLVRFYENAKEFSEERDGVTISGWEYDEYHLELVDTGSLEDDILNNFDAMLEQAKAAELPAEDPDDLADRILALEEAQADVWSSQAAAIREGVNSVD